MLESTRRIDIVVLDKTGTVTTDTMSLVDVVTADGVDRGETLRLVGALEGASEHPIGRAIAAGAAAEIGDLPPVDANHAGLGVEGTVEGHAVVAGRPALLADLAPPLPEALQRTLESEVAQGRSVIAAGWDRAAKALFVVADTVKPTSAEAIKRPRGLGLRPILLTGDKPRYRGHRRRTGRHIRG